MLPALIVAIGLLPGATMPRSITPALAQQQAATPAPSSASAPPKSTKPCVETTGAHASGNPYCAPRQKKKKKPAHPDSANTDPAKTVVRNGGTNEPTVAITPGLSQQQVSKQMQDTDRLLNSAESKLKAISSRQLSSTQQDTVTQIKSYMEQSKAAANAGDIQRAFNLANKADLLSADLLSH